MIKKMVRILANAVLVLLPFLPVLENIVLPEDHASFCTYLITCAVVTAFVLLLGLFVNSRNSVPFANNPTLRLAAWLLFLLGPIVMVPLHMGPPKQGDDLLRMAAEERFRYAMLLLAVVLFAVACACILKTFWSSTSINTKAIIVPLALAIPISLWDYFDSMTFGTQLTNWMNSGKNANDFFGSYNFHEVWRAAGRMLLYAIAAWLSVVACNGKVVRKWVAGVLVAFCLIGIFFCMATLLKGPAFYFPFMVPAIAMAPAYWLGIAFMNSAALTLSKASDSLKEHK